MSLLRNSFALAATCILAILPCPAAETVTVAPPNVRVPVFFATDRRAVDSNQNPLGAKISKLTYGTSSALLPMQNSWLDTNGKLSSRFRSMGWVVDEINWSVKPYLEVRGYVSEENSNNIVSTPIATDTYWDQLKNQVLSSDTKTLFIYIHGFASSGKNSLYAGAILAAHTESPVVVFAVGTYQR